MFEVLFKNSQSHFKLFFSYQLFFGILICEDSIHYFPPFTCLLPQGDGMWKVKTNSTDVHLLGL